MCWATAKGQTWGTAAKMGYGERLPRKGIEEEAAVKINHKEAPVSGDEWVQRPECCRPSCRSGVFDTVRMSMNSCWAFLPGSHPPRSLVNLSVCFSIFALGNPPHWLPDSKTECHLSLTHLHAVASFSSLLHVVPIIASANVLTPFLFPCPAHPWRTGLEFHITFPMSLFWFTIFSFCYIRACQISLGQIAFSNNGRKNISHSMCPSSVDTDNPSGEAGSRSPPLNLERFLTYVNWRKVAQETMGHHWQKKRKQVGKGNTASTWFHGISMLELWANLTQGCHAVGKPSVSE